jgi:hypothetical protein
MQPLCSSSVKNLHHYYGLLRLCAPHRYSHTHGGFPLVFLPWHRGDRFPCSVQKPESSSRRLYAGRRLGSKQVSPSLIPGRWCHPVLTSPIRFRHVFGRFTFVRLLDSYLTRCYPAFSSTLTTRALYSCSLRRFGACSCKPTPRGRPSSLVQHRTSGLASFSALMAHHHLACGSAPGGS